MHQVDGEINDMQEGLQEVEARGATLSYSPGHMLRCCTPAMMCSKRAAMPKNHMRCAAIESSICLKFRSRFLNISAIYYPIFKWFSALG